jgi:O-succinylbenzoate synthase
MKIDRITLNHVRVPLVEPFRISNGVVAEKDGILVGVHSGSLVGYGESSPMSGTFYSDDTPESVWKCLAEELIPLVMKENPESIEKLNALLDTVAGNAFAKAGIETGFWDLEAQRQGMPLWQMLGGSRRTVESGLAVGIYPTIKELLLAIERHLREGYKRVKIKIQPGWDVEPLSEIRRAFGAISLMVDANCAYSSQDQDHLKQLDAFDLMMIEQPLPKKDLEGHARLQALLQTPVCLDESAEDLTAVHRAIELKSCRIINIKIQRVGGLLHAREIHDMCKKAGIPVWAGTMPELGIGGVQTIHLASLENFSYPTDVESSKRWFVDDIVEPMIEVNKGAIALTSGPGNGCSVNQRIVEKYSVRKDSFTLN